MELITFHGFVPGPSKLKLSRGTEIRLNIGSGLMMYESKALIMILNLKQRLEPGYEIIL